MTRVVTAWPASWSERAIRNGSRSARCRTSCWSEKVTTLARRPDHRQGAGHPRQRVDGVVDRGPQPSPPKRTGIVGGQARLRRRSARRPRAPRPRPGRASCSGRSPTTFDGATSPATASCSRMNSGSFAIGNERIRHVVPVVLREPGLVDHDHRLRRRAVDQPERHRRVRRVVERALALDDDPVARGSRPPRASTRRCPGRSR